MASTSVNVVCVDIVSDWEKSIAFLRSKLQKLEFHFFCESIAKLLEVLAEQMFKFIEPIFVSSERRDLCVQKFVSCSWFVVD